ncbi:MAG: glycosyltransferase family 4 protein [Armatimonadota bacterium]|jgi:glycosyltransferase involved in cell wall biosynthesis
MVTGEDSTTERESPLTVLTIITPARYSGAERVAVYLAEGLQCRGHRVVFACKHNEQLLEALEKRGIEAHPLPISGKGNLMAPFLLAWFAEWVGADVIHTHLSTASLWGAVAGKLTGIPTIASVHALNIKTCYVYSDMLATCSEGVRQHMIAQGIPGERIEVMYNGLSPRQFEDIPPKRAVRDELDLPHDVPVIGEVAHLSPRKGQTHLLDAVVRLLERWPALICLLVGEGEDREALEARVAELGIEDHVRLTGYRPDARRIMMAMDVVVLPSVAIEGLGIALIEGAFVGKPVVGSDAPGIREALVDGSTGLLAPPGDAEALAGAIGQILENPTLAREMGRRGQERAESMFTLDHMVSRAEELYRRLLANNKL